MKAIACRQAGGPEVLEVVEHPEPLHGDGECLIRVAASGVNRPDVLQRKGLYPPPAGVSGIPGLEVAGVIEAGDEAALASAGFKLGDPVCALVAGGGYAERCVAPIAQCLPLPAGWTMTEAAGLPETLFTCWSNLVDQGELKAGDRVLIHGGSSGIGVTAIQLAKALGATVWVTVGSNDKAAACLQLGADGAINYREQDFVVEGLQATAGQGFDLILDMVAGAYIARNQQLLAEQGRLLLIAVQGGVKAEFDAGLLLRKRQRISGNTLRSRPLEFKAAIAARLRQQVWPLLEHKLIRPVMHKVFAASKAADAHREMEAGRHIGKLVLAWQGD